MERTLKFQNNAMPYGHDLDLSYKVSDQDIFTNYRQLSYAAVNVEDGEYFIGETRLEAVKKAKQKYPEKRVFVIQLGTLHNSRMA
ncbi:MAG: hypothetical protein ACOCXT_03615 [Candidatus Dojkabacteria bacterium]